MADGKSSLSARRAWIEIQALPGAEHPVRVALRKESVDRNRTTASHQLKAAASLSARRAWIEIAMFWPDFPTAVVALRKESVDRNGEEPAWVAEQRSRSPQGERG